MEKCGDDSTTLQSTDELINEEMDEYDSEDVIDDNYMEAEVSI